MADFDIEIHMREVEKEDREGLLALYESVFLNWSAALDELERLRRLRAKLEAALCPFVDGAWIRDEERDTDHADAVVQVTAGDLRRARAVLEKREMETK